MKGTTTRSERGEIVQVQGGHILRSTGRKDRHSKVYTSKGPRDRRVRLSAHTAIQFYDVQDRLGYDRPSKAVDWLINKAKTSIDRLNELPPWQPQPSNDTDSNPSSTELAAQLDHQHQHPHPHSDQNLSGYSLIHRNHNSNNSSFMAPPPGDQSEEAHMVNTMKSFFPTSSFPGFANDAVLPPRVSSSSFQGGQDLGLSLHSNLQAQNPFQDSSFQRIDGFFMNNNNNNNSQAAAMFPQRGILESNLGSSMNDDHDPQQNNINPPHRGRQYSWDFGNAFELGFRVPARIYGEDETDITHPQ